MRDPTRAEQGADARRSFDQAPCGLLVATVDGVISDVNETMLRWTGHRRDELLGRHVTDLLTPGGQIYYETHFAPLLRMQGQAREIALEIFGADRSRRPAIVNATLARGDDVPALRMALFDATERRRYELELLAAKDRAEVAEQRASALSDVLQRTLLPPGLPSVPHIDLAAVYRSASPGMDIGGDFYDAFAVSPDDVVLAIGDVEGKGPEAAIMTALARHTIRAAAVEAHSPAEILRTLNRAFVIDESPRLCTAAIVRLQRADRAWNCVVSCAGHPPPLFVGASRPSQWVGRPGMLLGYQEEIPLHDVEAAVAPGDRIVLYTDGVTEARAADRFLGDDGLQALVAGQWASSAELADAVLTGVLRFTRTAPRDDIAVLVAGAS
jgi:phosphoserine phosphatase RsbU/P